jgi:putative ABC transport system permease protein
MAARQKAQAAGTATEALVERVTLSSSSPQGRANSYDVLIKGFSDSSLPFESKRVATVPLALAQSLVGLENRVTEYAVSVDDMKNLERIAAELRTRLGPEYEVHTWQELQPLVRDGIMRLQFVLGFVSVVLGIIIITSIVNVMLMSVFERVREIGTMMAVGVRRFQVLTLFLLEAGLLGLLGSLGGVALGSALVKLIASKGIPMQSVGSSAQTILRPELHLSFVLITVVFAIAGAIAAAGYPAWRASRMNPVDALRSV